MKASPTRLHATKLPAKSPRPVSSPLSGSRELLPGANPRLRTLSASAFAIVVACGGSDGGTATTAPTTTAPTMFSWLGVVVASIVLVNVLFAVVLGAQAIWYHWLTPRLERRRVRRAIEELKATSISASERTLRLYRS